MTLLTLLKAAKPGDVIMPGEVTKATVKGLKFGMTDVVIRGARFLNYTLFQDCEDITFEDCEFADTAGSLLLMLQRCEGITLERCRFSGVAGAYKGTGVKVDGGSDVTIEHSTFQDLGSGIAHANTLMLTIFDNRLHDLGRDGIIGAGSSDVTISGNHLSDFYPQGAVHPDAIQFFTVSTTKAPGRNITITGNRFERGAGKKVQGIFIKDETDRLSYENVVVQGNVLLGAMTNGITVGGTASGEVSGNAVLGFLDGPSRINTSKAVKVWGNRANAYLGGADAALNETVKQMPLEAALALLAPKAPATLEERVAALEAEVAELKRVGGPVVARVA